MDDALEDVIEKLIKIKKWYAENKEDILKGDLVKVSTNRQYSELVVIGQHLSNLARGMLKVGYGHRDKYDDIVQYLLGNRKKEVIDDWFAGMMRMP